MCFKRAKLKGLVLGGYLINVVSGFFLWWVKYIVKDFYSFLWERVTSWYQNCLPAYADSPKSWDATDPPFQPSLQLAVGHVAHETHQNLSLNQSLMVWRRKGRTESICWCVRSAVATVAGQKRSQLLQFQQRQPKSTSVVSTLQIPVRVLSGSSGGIFCVLVCNVTSNVGPGGIASSPDSHELREQPSWTTTFPFISPFWACYPHSVSVVHNLNFWLIKILLWLL